MHSNHINTLLPPEPDGRDVPPELVDFVFEIAEDMVRSEFRKHLVHKVFWYTQPFVIRNDV